MQNPFRMFAMLSLVLPACGGAGSSDEDVEPGPDAGMNAGSADAGVAGVGTCAATYPTEGMKVVFHDAAGVPLGVVATDGAGLASFASCVPNGMVTLIRPSSEVDDTRRLFTVQGVNIGDTVRFTNDALAVAAVTPVSLTLQNDFDAVTQGAVAYVGTAGDCTSPAQALQGSSGGTISINNLATCLGDDPTTLVALSIARDANAKPVGFARSSTTDLISPSVATGGQWVAYDGPTQVMVANVPAGATSGFRTVIPKIDGVDYGVTYGSAPLADGPLQLDYWPSSIVDEHRIALSYAFSGDESSSGAYMRTTTPPSTLDASQILLARPRQIINDASDPKRPRITWNEGDARADLTRAELSFGDAAGPGVWVVVAPGNPRELQIPILDADHAALGPAEGSPAAVQRLLIIDRETTYQAHLAEGVMALSKDETYQFLGIRELAGTTLRYAGYAGS